MDNAWVDIYKLSFSEKFSIFRKQLKCFGFKRYMQIFLFQRIFRNNSDVPWLVHWSSIVSCPKNIRYKQWSGFPNPGISNGCYIQAMNGIEIGVNLRIAPGVKIISSNHDVNDYDRHAPAPPIRIGDNVWLGTNSVLLPGVEIGNHTVIAAGAVVNKSFKEGNCILGGVPAKIIKKLPDYKSLKGNENE